VKLKDMTALIEPALMPGESIEDFLNEAVKARAGKNGGFPSDDLSDIVTSELVNKDGTHYKHPARLPNLIPRCILAVARWNDTAPEGLKISPTNSVIAKLGNIRPNDLTPWMDSFKAHVQEQDEQWSISQFSNRSINRANKAESPSYLADVLIPKLELPKDGGASPKLQAA